MSLLVLNGVFLRVKYVEVTGAGRDDEGRVGCDVDEEEDRDERGRVETDVS